MKEDLKRLFDWGKKVSSVLAIYSRSGVVGEICNQKVYRVKKQVL
jgi:hypothetical protein